MITKNKTHTAKMTLFYATLILNAYYLERDYYRLTVAEFRMNQIGYQIKASILERLISET